MSKSDNVIRAVIFRRSDDENTVAVVTAEVDPAMMIETPNDLFGAVSEAVTRWIDPVTMPSEGSLALKANNGDFNVGDLAGHLGSPFLVAHLRTKGILRLDVECHVGDKTSWDYDDNLYDEAHLA